MCLDMFNKMDLLDPETLLNNALSILADGAEDDDDDDDEASTCDLYQRYRNEGLDRLDTFLKKNPLVRPAKMQKTYNDMLQEVWGTCTCCSEAGIAADTAAQTKCPIHGAMELEASIEARDSSK